MALVSCILDKFLEVVCHCFPPVVNMRYEKKKTILPLYSSGRRAKKKIKSGRSAMQVQCEGRTLFGSSSFNYIFINILPLNEEDKTNSDICR